MTKINRFMGPVQTQYQQTYVDQFVPLPFELMQKKADSQQKKFDTIKDFWGEFQKKMDLKVLPKDKQVYQTEVSGIQQQVEEALKGANGDWSKLDNIVKSAEKEWHRFSKTAEGALAQDNRVVHDNNLKELDESDMAGWRKDLYGEALDHAYNTDVGAVGNKSIDRFAPSKSTDGLVGDVIDKITKLEKWKGSKANYKYEDDGKLLVDWKRLWGNVSTDRIREVSETMVKGDESWNDQVYKDHKALSILGRIPKNKEGNEMTVGEYSDYVYDRDFLGKFDSFEKREYDESVSTKFTKKGELSSGQEFEDSNAIAFTKTERVGFDGDELKKLGDEGGNAIQYMDNKLNSDLDSTTESFRKELSLDANTFNDKLTSNGYGTSRKTDKGIVYDISTSDKVKLYNDILNGKDISFLTGGRASTNQSFKMIAKNALNAIDDNNQIKQEALDDYVDSTIDGITFTKKDFKLYKSMESNKRNAVRELRDIITDNNSSAKEKEDALLQMKIVSGEGTHEDYEQFYKVGKDLRFYKVVDNVINTIKKVATLDLPKEGDVVTMKQAIAKIDEKDPFLSAHIKATQLLKSKTINNVIADKAKALSNSNFETGFTNSLEMVDGKGHVDNALSVRTTSNMISGLMNIKNEILSSNTTYNNKVMTVEKALQSMAEKEAGDDGDAQEIFQGYKDEFNVKGSKEDRKNPAFMFSQANKNVFKFKGLLINKDGKLNIHKDIRYSPRQEQNFIKNDIILRSQKTLKEDTYLGPGLILHSEKPKVGSADGVVVGAPVVIITLNDEKVKLTRSTDEFMDKYAFIEYHRQNNKSIPAGEGFITPKKALEELIKEYHAK